MDTAEVLKTAWAAVQESGVPEDLHETAFELAVAHITGGANSARPAPPPPPPRPRAPNGGDAGNGFDETVDSEAIYARLSKESGIDIEDLREVILIEDGGEIAILTAGKDLGKTMTDQARNTTSLLAGVYFGGKNQRSMPVDMVREVCDDRGCYDSKNFKSKHLKNHVAVSVRDSSVHITGSKWLDAFTTAMNQARGVAA